MFGKQRAPSVGVVIDINRDTCLLFAFVICKRKGEKQEKISKFLDKKGMAYHHDVLYVHHPCCGLGDRGGHGDGGMELS